MPPVPKLPTSPASSPASTKSPAKTPATPAKSSAKSTPAKSPATPAKSTPAKSGRSIGEAATDVGKSAVAPVASRAQRAAISGGSIVVGLVAYAIGVAYLQRGWPGVTGWLKAKLFNETSQGPAVVPAMLFHTGPGAGGGLTAGTQTAAAPAPQQAAPTPTGGLLYA